GRPRVNSEVAATFVENLLIIRPNNSYAINLALRQLKPSHRVTLVSEVGRENMAFWVVMPELFSSQNGWVEARIFKELEKGIE
ncbi:hypothetical protein KI387_034800, partial [Taxus chinensis]